MCPVVTGTGRPSTTGIVAGQETEPGPRHQRRATPRLAGLRTRHGLPADPAPRPRPARLLADKAYQRVRHRDHRHRAAAALDQVGLTHRADARVSTLSGGEHQRVAVARALVKDPELILADEPTGNLDSTNEHIVIDLLRRACSQGRTIIVVTHSPGVAECADRVLRVHDGVVHDERDPDAGQGQEGTRAGHPA